MFAGNNLEPGQIGVPKFSLTWRLVKTKNLRSSLNDIWFEPIFLSETLSRDDYSPCRNQLLSDWVRDCYNGNLSAIRKHIEADPMIIEKRESVFRYSGLFHVIFGAVTINPTMSIPDEMKARVTDKTG